MAKRIKLPKRIAGIKIPKGIRKGPVIRFLNTPLGTWATRADVAGAKLTRAFAAAAVSSR